jgi:Polyketide cyclase / dehydrase and lipid transport
MTVHGMHREASIEIHASPEAVYDLISDLPRMGEWSPENIGGEWQGGGSGQVGDRASIMASATPFCFCTTQKHLSVKIVIISMG